MHATLFGGIILILLCLSLFVYAQSYVADIQANLNVSSTDKQIVKFIPTLLIVFTLALAGMLVYTAVRKGR